MTTAIVALIVALLSFLGGLLTQRASSKAAKEKLDREYRAAAIKAWREKLIGCSSVKEFLGTAEYSALRSHLYPKLRDPIEDGSLEWAPPGARPGTQAQQALLDYISTLERWWGLMPYADGEYAPRRWQRLLFRADEDRTGWRRLLPRRREVNDR